MKYNMVYEESERAMLRFTQIKYRIFSENNYIPAPSISILSLLFLRFCFGWKGRPAWLYAVLSAVPPSR